MSKSVIKYISPPLVVAVGLALLVSFGYLWWVKVYSAPQNTFEAMLNNSLRLRGASRQVVQKGQQSTEQLSSLTFVPLPIVAANTTLYQLPATTVVTQSIGTPYDDYVRYTSIETDQTNQAGEVIDFSNIVNVWGRSPYLPDTGRTDGELFAESVLGVVPFGDLGPEARQELVAMMLDGKVYNVDYNAVVRSINDGRPQYTYNVEVNAESYIIMLKRFGELAGLNNLDDLDPAAYRNVQALPFSLTVDVWSRQLVELDHTQSGRREIISGHNATQSVTVPSETITVEELQERLQSLQ